MTLLLLGIVFGSGFAAGWLLQPLWERQEPTAGEPDPSDDDVPVVTPRRKSAAYRRRMGEAG